MKRGRVSKMIENSSNLKKGIVILIIIIIVLILYFILSLHKDLKAAKARMDTYQEKTKQITTQYGKMTFIDEGGGEVILSIHGICGGYDQAYDTVKDKTAEYRIIAPSRFGYPGSGMPENARIEDQTSAFVELLDQLNIEKAYILATSAGGTSGIKFALDHPERTKGLILYSSGYPALEKPEKDLTQAGPPEAICSNTAMYALSPFFKPIMGMESSTIHTMMPMEERKEGIVFDGKVTNTVMVNHFEEYDMGSLQVPVLIFHAKDDQVASYDGVEDWAKKIKDCTFVPFETGGHLMEGNGEEINRQLDEFVKRTK